MKLWDKTVQFVFRLFYNEMAFTYDMVSKAVSLGDWRAWQRAVFEFLPSPSETGILLELAHGTGNLQEDLSTRGFYSIGLDLSVQMGKITLKKLAKLGISPRLIR
ncbi:MAG TPA: class I SAM-dependent methyltransferase, partial [Aggregatilineales bacterium]|nr:class I SAM-dependent methyltransferase [Aggregatilineales bacterium]